MTVAWSSGRPEYICMLPDAIKVEQKYCAALLYIHFSFARHWMTIYAKSLVITKRQTCPGHNVLHRTTP